MIIRNEYGQLMGAMGKKCDFPLKALEVEAEAIEEGIIFARELSLKKEFWKVMPRLLLSPSQRKAWRQALSLW